MVGWTPLLGSSQYRQHTLACLVAKLFTSQWMWQRRGGEGKDPNVTLKNTRLPSIHTGLWGTTVLVLAMINICLQKQRLIWVSSRLLRLTWMLFFVCLQITTLTTFVAYVGTPGLAASLSVWVLGFFDFETVSCNLGWSWTHFVNEADPEFWILLLSHPKCWVYWCESSTYGFIKCW